MRFGALRRTPPSDAEAVAGYADGQFCPDRSCGTPLIAATIRITIWLRL